MRRYHEQLSEENAWFSSAEDRYTALKQSTSDVDVSHITSLSDEVNKHIAVVIDLRESIIKLSLEQVTIKNYCYRPQSGRISYKIW